MSELICDLCERPAADAVPLGDFPAVACRDCTRRLGKLIHINPRLLGRVWPHLVQGDDGSPEPRVRLPDGRSVELRERTAELKRDLPMEKRAELAELLGELGLEQELLLEAATVLEAEVPPELVARAAAVLFRRERAAPDAVEQLRPHLRPS